MYEKEITGGKPGWSALKSFDRKKLASTGLPVFESSSLPDMPPLPLICVGATKGVSFGVEEEEGCVEVAGVVVPWHPVKRKITRIQERKYLTMPDLFDSVIM